jgi:hypothetical protein
MFGYEENSTMYEFYCSDYPQRDIGSNPLCVKALRDGKHLESAMTERILQSSISMLEAFNDVRNNKNLAHDNPILNYEESLLIFNRVAASIRFIKALKIKIKATTKVAQSSWDDDIPF